MKLGLSTSLALHVALLAWAVLSLPSTQETAVPVVDALPVEFVPMAPETNLRLGDNKAKPKDEIVEKDAAKAEKDSEGKRAGTSKQEEPPPAPPEQKQAALPKEEPKPAPPKPPEVKPVAKPEPPKPEAKKEPEPDKPKEAETAKDLGEGKKPEPKEPPKDEKAVEKLIEKAEKTPPKKEPPKKPDPVKTAAVTAAAGRPAASTTKSQFDAKDISAILNRNATGTSASATAPRTASLGSVTGKNANVKMTQNEVDALIGQIKKCWNPPIGAAEARIKVTMRFALNQDGTVNGRPQPMEAPAHPLGPGLARSAERAIIQCGPYNLPAEKYSTWADVAATFDPNDL